MGILLDNRKQKQILCFFEIIAFLEIGRILQFRESAIILELDALYYVPAKHLRLGIHLLILINSQWRSHNILCLHMVQKQFYNLNFKKKLVSTILPKVILHIFYEKEKTVSKMWAAEDVI